jgi:hypothetical protein
LLLREETYAFGVMRHRTVWLNGQGGVDGLIASGDVPSGIVAPLLYHTLV